MLTYRRLKVQLEFLRNLAGREDGAYRVDLVSIFGRPGFKVTAHGHKYSEHFMTVLSAAEFLAASRWGFANS